VYSVVPPSDKLSLMGGKYKGHDRTALSSADAVDAAGNFSNTVSPLLRQCFLLALMRNAAGAPVESEAASEANLSATNMVLYS
jgi:hypothetical protein